MVSSNTQNSCMANLSVAMPTSIVVWKEKKAHLLRFQTSVCMWELKAFLTDAPSVDCYWIIDWWLTLTLFHFRFHFIVLHISKVWISKQPPHWLGKNTMVCMLAQCSCKGRSVLTGFNNKSLHLFMYSICWSRVFSLRNSMIHDPGSFVQFECVYECPFSTHWVFTIDLSKSLEPFNY